MSDQINEDGLSWHARENQADLGVYAREIYRLRKESEKLSGELAVAKAFHDVAVAQRNLAWQKLESIRSVAEESKLANATAPIDFLIEVTS